MATKQQIADAARALFAEHGYVSTTISAISEAADIPAPTIYSAFASKAAILQYIAMGLVAALDVDRNHSDALSHPDPAQGLRLAAKIQRRQFELMYDVITIYQEAARTDRDIARATEIILANRENAFRRHVAAIEARLAPGVSIDDGVDVYLALVLPEVYRTLVIERGWTRDRYEHWLANALEHYLLGSSDPWPKNRHVR